MSVSNSKIESRIERAVSDYIDHHRPRAQRELRFFTRTSNFLEAIWYAALSCTPTSGKHPHQWRIPRATLKEFATRLLVKAEDLRGASSFEEIHRIVSGVGKHLKGIGELTVYDTALRIGANRRHTPSRVYLHRGTRDGALALGIGPKRQSLGISDLPSAFARLEPHEIEDCLCIFKELLAGKRSLKSAGCLGNGRACAYSWDGASRKIC